MNSERVLMVLKRGFVSEKASSLADKYKQITFTVAKNSTKLEIKKAVEQIFNVKVKKVTTLIRKVNHP